MLLNSDRSRFEQLYQEHQRLVRGVLCSMVDTGSIDDLTQEVFLRVWRGLPRFAFRSSMRTWVYRVTLNTAIDHLRQTNFPTVPIEDEHHEAECTLSLDENRLLVDSALKALDHAHRSVVVLYFLEELSIDEIAKVLELPPGTVKSRLHTARGKLRLFLSRKGVTHEIA